MSRTPQPVRGTQSLIGEAADRLHRVVNAFKTVRDLFGFGRVEVPIFEQTAVFARSLGETTDVVSKEMYTFPDRSGESLTLRPEFTAGIARAYLSEGWQQFAPLKVVTHGPAFRYERPQKGRFRQFHQVDAEIIGAAEPQADVEAICFAAQLLDELGLAQRATLNLNTTRPPFDDPRARQALFYALDRSLLAEAATPNTPVVTNLFPSTSPFYDAAYDLPAQDPEAAQRLFDELAAEGKPLEWTLTVTPSPSETDLVDSIIAQLAEYETTGLIAGRQIDA